MNVKRLFRGFVTTLMMTVLFAGTAFAEFSAETETAHNEIGISKGSQTAELKPGETLNKTFKQLSGSSSATYSTTNTNINAILRSPDAPGAGVSTKEIQQSGAKVLAWFDSSSGTIYWYSGADTVYANAKMNRAFNNFQRLNDLTGLSDWDASKVTDMSYMFYGCSGLEDLSGLDGWITDGVTTLAYAFANCSILDDLSGLSEWNTSSVTTLDYTFQGCKGITSLESLSNWKTSSVKSLKNTFYNCSGIRDLSGLSGWNTSSVTTLVSAFSGCSNLTDISALREWDIEKVTTLSSTFQGCKGITNLEPLSNWKTDSLTKLGSTFYGCSTLADISGLSEWNTSSVTDLSSMFYGCSVIDDVNALSEWNTNSVTSIGSMFYNCSKLSDAACLSTHLADSDVYTAWDVTKAHVSTSSKVFDNTQLKKDFSAVHTAAIAAKYPNWYLRQTRFVNGEQEYATAQYPLDAYLYENMKPADPARDPSKIGVFFTGWNTKEDGKGTKLAFTSGSSGNKYCSSPASVYYAIWEAQDTVLKSGLNLNVAFKKLSGSSSATYTTANSNIKAIRQSNDAPGDGVTTQEIQQSGEKVLAWFDDSDGTIYWYSVADVVYANEDMSEAFRSCSSLSELAGLSDWNMDKVTKLASTFSGCSNLTDISVLKDWNIEKVTTLASTFGGCKGITNLEPLSNWKTGSVTDFSSTFYGCAFDDTTALSEWDTSSAMTLASVFRGCKGITSLDPLSNWKTGSVQNMSYAFCDCLNLTDIAVLSGWDTSSVTNLSYMFSGCSALDDITALSEWNTSKVSNVSYMFDGCSEVSNALCLSTHQADDYTAWDMSKVTFSSKSGVFHNTMLENDYKADFRQYTKYPDWYLKTTQFMNETQKVAEVKYPYAPGLAQDALPDGLRKQGFGFVEWNTKDDGKGTKLVFTAGYRTDPADVYYAIWEKKPDAVLRPGKELNRAFKGLGGTSSSSSDFNIKAIKRSNDSPDPAKTMVAEIQETGEPVLAWFDDNDGTIYWYSEAGTVYANEDMGTAFHGLVELNDLSGLSDWDTSNVTTLYGTFDSSGITNLEQLSNWNTANVTSLEGTFYNCSDLSDISALSKWNTDRVTTLADAFSWCGSLKTLHGLEGWNTSAVTDMSKAFYKCHELSDLSALAEWNTGNVIDMSETFGECSQLTTLSGLEDWDVSNVEYLGDNGYFYYGTFTDCTSLTDISALANWDVRNVQNMDGLFARCSSLTDLTPLKGWNVGNVQNMGGIFRGCSQLTTLSGLEDWNVANVKNHNHTWDGMFANCTSLTDIKALMDWNVSGFDGTSYMFSNCSSLTDLSGIENWTTDNITTMQGMFYGCENLEDLSQLENWNVGSVTSMGYMFQKCSLLSNLTPLQGWRPGEVTDISGIFSDCLTLTDASALDGWNVRSNIPGNKSNESDALHAFYNSGVTRYPTWYRGFSTTSALTLDGNGGTVFGEPVITITPETESEADTEPESLSAEYGIDPVMLDDEMVLPDIVLLDDAACEEPEEDEMVASPSVATLFVASASDALRDNILVLPEAERDGFTFLGWSDEEDGEVVYEAGDEIVIDGEMVLYAVWAEEPAAATPSNASRSNEPADAGAASDPDVTEATPSEASRAKEDKEEIPSSRPDPESDPEPAPIEAATPSEPKRETDASESDPADGEPIEPNNTNE